MTNFVKVKRCDLNSYLTPSLMETLEGQRQGKMTLGAANLGIHHQALTLHAQLLEQLSHCCKSLKGSGCPQYLDQCSPCSPILSPAALENEHLKSPHQTQGCLSLRSQQKQGPLHVEGETR